MPVKTFLVACLLAGLGLAAANDIPIKFCAKDCNGDAQPHLRVQLSGCTDRPFTCMTDGTGCCSIDKAPEVIQYCYGSAGNLCQWSIFGSALNLAPDVPTLTRKGMPVIAREYSCCKCAGGGEFCPNVIFGDAANEDCRGGLAGISTSSSNGYFTVNFKPVDCCTPPPPASCANYSCPGSSMPKMPLPDLSGGLLVNDTNCCTPPTCATYSCPYNNAKMPPPSSFDLVVNEANCCTPTCKDYVCPSGSLKSPAPMGDDVVRNDATCCDACPLICSVTVSKNNGNNSVSTVVPGNCSSALTGGNATTCPDEYFQSNETCPGGNCGVCCFLRTTLCGAGINGPCSGQPGAGCQCFESKNGANCAASNLYVPDSYNASLIEGGGGCQENNCNAVAAKSGKAGACCPYPCTGPGNSGKKKAFRRFG